MRFGFGLLLAGILFSVGGVLFFVEHRKPPVKKDLGSAIQVFVPNATTPPIYIAPVPQAITVQEATACGRSAYVRKASVLVKEQLDPSVATRTMESFRDGEDLHTWSLYGIDGKIYACCSTTTFRKVKGGWVYWHDHDDDGRSWPVHLRRSGPGFVMDCDSATPITDESNVDGWAHIALRSEAMMPIIGTFSTKKEKVKK